MKKKQTITILTTFEPICSVCGSDNICRPYFKYVTPELCMLEFSCEDCGEGGKQILIKDSIEGYWRETEESDGVVMDLSTMLPKKTD